MNAYIDHSKLTGLAATENMKKLLETDNLMELKFEAITSLKKIASSVETDGTIILAGCLSGQCGDIVRSDDLITSLDRLFEGRVQILMNGDYTRNLSTDKLFLDRPRSAIFNYGWRLFKDGVDRNLNKDIKLNSQPNSEGAAYETVDN